ncbi:MAG TPA: hypothetical protein VHA56_12110 [Mucilaginibacter sp.]|nr:hypothetical protein [Mucilaginibacter sp.]
MALSFKKIAALNRRQWLENRQAYGLTGLALTVVLLLFFFIGWHWRESFPGAQGNGIFLIGLFGGGIAFSGWLYKELSRPADSIWLLGLPASAGQKILIFLLHSIIFYGVGFTLLFRIIETIFYDVVAGSSAGALHSAIFENGFYTCYLTFINIQLWLLIGSLTFKKAAIIKTVLLLLLYFILAASGNVMLMKMLTGEAGITSSLPYGYFQFVHENENIYVYLPALAQHLVDLLGWLLPCFLIYIAYLKLMEKEITA